MTMWTPERSWSTWGSTRSPCSEQRTTEDPLLGPERPASGTEIRLGERLGRYIVGSQVGMGGGGVVYAAYDDALERPVALKVLWKGAHDPEAIAHEARAIAELSHPNIVTVYDVGVDRGRSFVVMELVHGGSMRRWLERSRPTPARIVAMLMQAARGLAHAHGRGIVHRDFKLDNVLVGGDGRVLVTDFGLASPRGVVPRRALAGTPRTMAPEQHAGEAVDHTADQFALCVELYYALHGADPFPGESVDDKHAAKKEGRVRAFEPGLVPRRVSRAVARGLSARPVDRFPSMYDLVAAIEGGGHRRWIAVSAAALVLGGASLTLGSSHPEPCQPEPTIWSRQDAERVREALRATGTPFAESTEERVDQLLSVYAREWSHNRALVCERMAHSPIPQRSALESVERCLHRARLRADALTTVLGQVERETVGYAAAAAELLPSPERCWHRPEPLGRWDDPAWAELESELARAQAHGVVGAFEVSLDVAQHIASAGEAAAAPGLVARARLLEGRAELELAHPELAFQALERAYYGAVTVGDDDLASEAAAELLRVATRELADIDLAHKWERTALASSARLPPYGESEAHLLYARAERANTAGDREAWVELHRQALAIRRRSERPSLSLADSLEGLGQALLHTGRPGSARGLFEEALEIRRSLLGPYHPWLAVAHNNYGVALAMIDEPVRAHEHLEAGLQILESSLGPRHPRVGRVLNNLGKFDLARGEVKRAREYLEPAVSILESIHGPAHHELLTARNNLIKALSRGGQPKRALALARRMLVDAESGSASVTDLVSIHALLGSTLRRVGEHEAALGSYRRALVMAEGLPAAWSRRPHIQLGMARALVSLGRDEQAAGLLRPLRSSTNDRDLESQLASVLAGIELRRGRQDDALALAQTARDLLPTWARADRRRVQRIDAIIEQLQGQLQGSSSETSG
ncbi:MAG: protein kinase [Myxococcota bacterium]